MLGPKTTCCAEGGDIQDLLKRIDCKLAELGNDLYNNVVFMLNRPVYANKIVQLLTYRRILTYKYYNIEYANKYTVEDIASKVIRLTAGCERRCPEPPPVCETTTTTSTTENPFDCTFDVDIVCIPTTTTTTSMIPV